MRTAVEILAGALAMLSFCGGLLFSIIVIIALISGSFDINITRKF